MLPSSPLKVALLGFTDFERNSLASALTLAVARAQRYLPVTSVSDADLLVADADDAASLQLVRATERDDRTLFVGAQPPADGGAWAPRPIDAQRVLAQLDALAATAGPALTPATLPPVLDDAVESALLPPPVAPSRALLVDADPDSSRRLEQRLLAAGWQADLTVDSGAALELLARHDYAVVFVDSELGEHSELDGLALCRRIRQSPATLDASVVLLSARANQAERVRATLAGCDACVAKPVGDDDLQRLLPRPARGRTV